ncbi:MAG: hypothetical protein WCP93_00535 [Candidatus Berkelbacteria bacterium]
MNKDIDLEEIEEELKLEVDEYKTGHKVSGRSVFELQRIIVEKAENDKAKKSDKN